MSIYISPDFKPSRRFFYILISAWIFLSVQLILDGGDDYEFGVGALISSVIALIFGVIIIHAGELRDRIFGLSECPRCKKKTISIKDKLKAKTHGRSDAQCRSCGFRIALPWIYLFHSFILVFLPIVLLLIFESLKAMFISAWALGILYSIYFGRSLRVVRQK